MKPVHVIVYASSSTQLISNKQLEDILTISRKYNKRDNITGLLLYEDGNFLQVLEGPKSALDLTFKRITDNPLHKGIIPLLSRTFPSRSFNAWSMGYTRLFEEKVQQALPGYDIILERAPAVILNRPEINPAIKNLLLSYRKIVTNRKGKINSFHSLPNYAQ